jgi:hypothetical protein
MQRGRRLHTADHPPIRTAYFARGSAPRRQAQVAQLVEHATENRSVGSSILPLGTIAHNLLIFIEIAAELRLGASRE